MLSTKFQNIPVNEISKILYWNIKQLQEKASKHRINESQIETQAYNFSKYIWYNKIASGYNKYSIYYLTIFLFFSGHVVGATVKFAFLFFEFFIPYVFIIWLVFGGEENAKKIQTQSGASAAKHFKQIDEVVSGYLFFRLWSEPNKMVNLNDSQNWRCIKCVSKLCYLGVKEGKDSCQHIVLVNDCTTTSQRSIHLKASNSVKSSIKKTKQCCMQL